MKVYIVLDTYTSEDEEDSVILGVYTSLEKAKAKLNDTIEILKHNDVVYDNMEWRSENHTCWDGTNDNDSYYTCLRIIVKDVEE